MMKDIRPASSLSDDVDDGHVVADMSMLSGREPSPLGEGSSSRSASDELSDPDDRRAAILGTLKAALSVGMVYVVVFGIAIAIMVWLWS